MFDEFFKRSIDEALEGAKEAGVGTITVHCMPLRRYGPAKDYLESLGYQAGPLQEHPQGLYGWFDVKL